MFYCQCCNVFKNALFHKAHPVAPSAHYPKGRSSPIKHHFSCFIPLKNVSSEESQHDSTQLYGNVTSLLNYVLSASLCATCFTSDGPPRLACPHALCPLKLARLNYTSYASYYSGAFKCEKISL